MQARLFSWIMAHRLGIVLAMAVMTLFFGFFAARIRFDNTIESYFLEADLESYHRFLEAFGTDEIVVVAFSSGDIFTEPNFRLIDAISRRLESLPHVRRVLSLTRANVVSGEGPSLQLGPLTPALPSTPAELAAIRRRALADPIIRGTLVSADGRSTAVVAEIDHLIGSFDYKVDLLGRVRAFLADQEARTGRRFFLGGTSVLDEALFRFTQRDQERFLPLMIVIISGLMYVMFRSLVTALVPFAVVLVSVLWTYGLMSLLGYRINVISTIIAPLLMSVAIADAMHVLTDYVQQVAAGGGVIRLEGIRRSFEALLVPCVMTSVTTILGLLSLLTADLVPVRQFGLVAAAGVAAALVATILLVPILLSVLPVGRLAGRAGPRGRVFLRLLDGLGRWRRGRAVAVLVVSFLAVPAAVLSAVRLTVGTNSLDYFRADAPVRLETEWIDAHVAGTTSLEFLLEADSQTGLVDPAVLRKMERFQAYLKGVEGVTHVFSVVDLIKTLNRGFRGGDPSEFRIPASRAALAQELLIVEGSDDLAELLSPDRSQARITARIAMNRSRELAHRMPEIEAQMERIFGTSIHITPTGLIYLMNRMERYLLSSQVKSFLLAFAVIALAMVAMLRSLRLGLLAMIPNFLPLLFTIALMPVFGIALDVGTVMIASVALGLIVDDTIHFLYRVRQEAVTTQDTRQAIAAAMRATGRPIIYTSVALSLGFCVLVFASFNPVIHFGVLATTVILLALVFDLVVLPAIMGFVRVV